MTREKIFDYGEIPDNLMAEAHDLIAGMLRRTRSSSQPRFIHLCGIPGSGKTTYAEKLMSNEPRFALVQFDGVMESLAGYRADVERHGAVAAFKDWQLPARVIGYHLLQALLENGRDVLFDHSAYCSNHLILIDIAKAWGYETEMHYLNCSVQLCLQRVRDRENKIGRHTPPELIVERDQLLKELLPRYKARVGRFVEVEQVALVVESALVPNAVPA